MFYAVINGRVEKPTIFKTWDECKEVVLNYSNAKYKKFEKWEDANKYIRTNYVPASVPKKSRYKHGSNNEFGVNMKDEVLQLLNNKQHGTKGENRVEQILLLMSINFTTEEEVSFEGYPHRFDFAIRDNRNQIVGFIEYDGRQHREAISKFGGEEEFKKRQVRDAKKDEYCKTNKLFLIRIADTEWANIDKILRGKLTRYSPKSKVRRIQKSLNGGR